MKTFVIVLAMIGAGAAGAPPQSKPVPQAAPVISIERKAGWMLRLEQQRVLTDPSAGASLIQLAQDTNPGVRRRAMLALGRVGMVEGLPPLVAGHNALEDARYVQRVLDEVISARFSDPQS